MKKEIIEKKSHEFILLLILGFSLIERIYNKTSISGAYSVLISALLIIFTLFYDIKNNENKYKIDKKLFFTIPIALYIPCVESARYAMFFILIVLWSKYVIKNLHKFSILMIIIGLFFSMFQIIAGADRISGFIYSPTLYSCILVIFNTYLLFEKEHTFFSNICVILALIMIYMTGSSSAFLCMLGIMIYKIVINLFLSKKDKTIIIEKGKKQIITFLLIISIILISIYIIKNLDNVLSIIQRDNRDASTGTRIKYLTYFLQDYVSSIKTFLIGHGGGFTQKYIRILIGTGHYYPLHQDIVMILCEYGIIGCIYIYINFLSKLKFTWLMYIILILCSFHNIVLASNIMVLIIIVSNSLNEQYKNNKIWY